jgi:2-methylaconitate cis-trans-isomerase PrpF
MQRSLYAVKDSPDPNKRQIDGIGGAISTTSKVAVISPSDSPEYDVVYHFGQVSIDRPNVEFKGNCGRVRIYQKNTNKLITAEVPVKNGRFNEEGDYEISGVPGSC